MTTLKKYAPSEYHVGPHRPWSEKLAEEIDAHSEGADNSGRNTPVDMESITENTVNPGNYNNNKKVLQVLHITFCYYIAIILPHL